MLLTVTSVNSPDAMVKCMAHDLELKDSAIIHINETTESVKDAQFVA